MHTLSTWLVTSPRLRDSEVLCGAIRDGISSLTWRNDTFAYAPAYEEASGRYPDLAYGGHAQRDVVLDSNSVVVKSEVAQRQLDEDRAAQEAFTPSERMFTPPGEQPPLGETGEVWRTEAESTTTAVAERIVRRFSGHVRLDAARLNRQVPEIAELVVQHLVKNPGAEVKVTLSIEGELADGFPDKVVIDVTQNAKDLKFEDFGFRTT